LGLAALGGVSYQVAFWIAAALVAAALVVVLVALRSPRRPARVQVAEELELAA